ncbi:MAG TPA: serine/threonine-protein kinase [Coleofasciculaceae cyanobacterium]|jgi:WD40 repeat protein
MTYCVNPDCPKPQNPEINKFCQGCGFDLLLQRYRATELIGQGGFSRTFLAVDEGQSPPSPCVLKQLWTKNLTPEVSNKAVTLFQQEILQLEKLGNHPQIPTLLAHFEHNQYLYLVQEFIDGTNLARVVQQNGTFSEAQIWQLLDDLLPLLKFIHDHQVIHRDIKPENIIRRHDGQIVLVDFGAAKVVTGRESVQAGTCIGSPEYVAPEQARGKAVFASDLYSLGVSCIYLLTCIPPFDLFDVVNDCWAWRDYLTQDVSADLAQILDKLLAYAIAHRFQSADEVMQAINQVRGQKRREKGENLLSHRGQTDDLINPSLTTQRWQCLHTLANKSAVNSVAISPDGRLLASGSDDKSIRLWNLDTGQAISTLIGHSQSVQSVAFNPDGTILATGSDDQTVKLWNLNDHQEICTFFGHSQAVKSVAFNPQGNLLASGSWDKTIKLWNVQTGIQESTLVGHRLQVTSVAFSPCGKFLASGSFDRTIRLWELSSGLSSTLEGHSWAVFAVAYPSRTPAANSPDGKTLATGGGDNTIILWDLNTGKPLYTLLGHSWSVVAVAYSSRTPVANSPDGETLLSGSWDKTIKLWQVSTGQEIASLSGHLDSVSAVAISPSRQIIASGSKDKTVKLWHRVG